jgi:hypothetical protein
MANLPETPQWEEGIYQIEVSDPVLGGPDGISNRQGKQLASRTLYLKQQVEKGGSELAKHIAAADPHTQYAPKASPTFTGTPTAPTPANSDNSKKLATTEFVAKALAALAGSAPETLDTLKELADALGNDPNFATTVLNKLAEKLAKDQNGADIPDPALFVKNLQLGEVANAPYIKSRGGNANGSWTIWSDGAIELTGMSQGVVNGLATINYPIALPYVSRHISIAEHQAVDTGPTDNYVHVSTIIGDQVTKSGFKARCTMAATGTPSSSGFSWRVYCAPSV